MMSSYPSVFRPALAVALLFSVSLASAAPLPLKVVKTEVRDSRGRRVRLRGVNAASLEWTSNGEGHILDTIRVAIQDWHANIIRVPLSQDRWFGKAPEQKDGGTAYRDLVKKVVNACSAADTYVILDLHWSDTGVWGKQIGQHTMPDENSVAFWKECAAAYKNQPAVLFDLYNEPHDTTWDIWLNGGEVTEKDRQRNYTSTYKAVGMQKLLDTVRATGAKNVVVAGGLDWAYDMSGFLNGHQLKDLRGSGVIYANHTYPFKGDTVEKWIAKMEAASREIPVIVSEFGDEGRRGPRQPGQTAAPAAGPSPWVADTLKALKDHDWDWTAWDLHPAAGPRLVSDWKYTPTPAFGIPVKEALALESERRMPWAASAGPATSGLDPWD